MLQVENARRVIAALRSGKLKQGREALQGPGETYCCLGVICRVAIDAGESISVRYASDGSASFDGNSGYLPPSAFNWLYVNAELPDGDEQDTIDPHFDGVAATARNDEMEQSFEQIADALEADLNKQLDSHTEGG